LPDLSIRPCEGSKPSQYPPFHQAGIPEIVDFNVLIQFRRMKIGTALLDDAEKLIAICSPVAGLGVCMHIDYGPAHVLYARRGYVPDGRGIFYHDHHPKSQNTESRSVLMMIWFCIW
jgi:hypothetical protein